MRSLVSVGVVVAIQGCGGGDDGPEYVPSPDAAIDAMIPCQAPATYMPGTLAADVQEAIREATQLSATAIKEALEAIKEGLEAARLSSDDAREQMEEMRRQMERARRDLEQERREMERRGGVAARKPEPPAPAAPAAPASPAKPFSKPFPTISGGKLVTGTLNGGGPEISISTMNGDVILRELSSGN